MGKDYQMKTIWKYHLEITDIQTIEIPASAKPLTVQMQHETACLWAVLNQYDAQNKIPFEIRMYGTGHPIKWESDGEFYNDYTYLNTIQVYGGTLIFHVFYRKF